MSVGSAIICVTFVRKESSSVMNLIQMSDRNTWHFIEMGTIVSVQLKSEIYEGHDFRETVILSLCLFYLFLSYDNLCWNLMSPCSCYILCFPSLYR